MSLRNLALFTTLATLTVPFLSRGQGIITTVVGQATVEGGNGDGGPALAAIVDPIGLALDSAGNLYIADYQNARIRKVDNAGIITTIAGNGSSGFAGDGGPAIAAELNHPWSVAVDSAGNVYAAERVGNRVRKVTPAGIISTIAGTGAAGFSGDGGPGASAQLYNPFGVAVDRAGNVFIADTQNYRIRMVTPAGIISTVAGIGLPHFSGDGGPATSAGLFSPYGVWVDGAGSIFIADTSNIRIRKVDAQGIISTVAGGAGSSAPLGDGGPAIAANIDPHAVTVDNAGNIYIADTTHGRIRKVDTAGIITTVAGNGDGGPIGDGGPATSAVLSVPQSVVVDGAGNIYIADTGLERVRKVSAATAAPQITADGITNAASFAKGSLVPGSIATVFGANLTTSAGINLASTLPLPKQFLNVSVKVNGSPAPIFAVDNVAGQQQINFQAPWEIALQSSATVQVVNNGVASSAIKVPVLSAQPGIFAYSAGGNTFGAILHSNFQLADTAHPASSGETVLIYCTGLGAVSPAQQDGTADAGATSTIVKPIVTIGGHTASISYSGLAPGYVGLYQINAVVPSGIGPGNEPVVIMMGGVSSKSALLPVR